MDLLSAKHNNYFEVKMLDALKFCAGAIAKKNYVSELTHFVIEMGRVRAFNGVLALSSPIDFDLACRPKAATFIKAIQQCEDTIQLNITPTGRLSVKSGKFKCLVDCIQEDTAHALPEGQLIKFDGEALYAGIQMVAPFIGTDASRRWSHGILVRDGCLFATCNVILVQYWLGSAFPSVVNIPKSAVMEMLRIGEAPLYGQVAENSITFHYSGDRWLRTQLYSASDWPNLAPILGKPSNQQPIQEDLFVGLATVKPFIELDGSIYFSENKLATSQDEATATSFDLESMQHVGRFHINMLQLLEGVATTIDWSTWPEPCMFRGERLRGAIVGMKI
jgi:hypothetical protein